jgi:uncharacterized protein YjiS (DUF1127 family)
MAMHTDIRSFRAVAPTVRRRLIFLLDCWVAMMIAHRERAATRFALDQLNDRELKDIGIHRSQIADGLANARKQVQ